VVNGLARPAAARTVASYYGVPGPDEATMMRWMRALFDAVFLDTSKRANQAAALTVAEQRPYMEALILERRAAVMAGEPVPDDMLTRLVRMGADEPWLDDDVVRRNINGVIVGAVDTTSKSVAHVVDELLRRPMALDGARQAALDGNVDAVRAYAWEALRFLPHAPLLQRSSRGATLGRGARKVPADKVVLVSLLSAMFDPAAFPSPGGFRPDRPEASYLHFGHGMHTCFGLAVNRVQIPELVAAVVALPGLRRAPGADGKLVYDGPFPDRLLVDFDPDERA
jgi:cytochrome P450